MPTQLEQLFAKKFIARTDVKAMQNSDGSWQPVRKPWTAEDLTAHISGQRTYGHYCLNQASQTKLITFDIDLAPFDAELGRAGVLPAAYNDQGVPTEWQAVEDLRAAWHNRDPEGLNGQNRLFMKSQFNHIARLIAKNAKELLGIPVAVAYSGNKGMHVYCFTGLIDAQEAVDGGRIVLESIGHFELVKGDTFFSYMVESEDWYNRYDNLIVEIYPKQATISESELGNLVRLPLGVNRKHTDPCFFVDVRTAMNVIAPRDPVEALTVDNQWA